MNAGPAGVAAPVQLTQYAVTPAGIDADMFAPIVANYLVEQAERHALHYFVLEALLLDGSSEQYLVLWLFQPAIALATSDTRPATACKVLYQESGAELPAPSMPLLISPVHCSRLRRSLEASTAYYVEARQALGPWRVGWLPLE